MTSYSWGGAVNNTSSFTSYPNNFVYIDGIGMPTTALAANGNRPIQVDSIGAGYAAGAAGIYAAINYQGSGNVGSGTWGTSGGTFRFVIGYSSGTLNFGRNTGIGGTVYDAADGLPFGAGIMPGSLQYYEVPSAPTSTTFVQNSVTEATLSWTAPASNGGRTITGYRIMYATNASYTGATTLDVGVMTSRKLTGLTPGLQYWSKVAAINSVASGAGTSSVYSASKSVVIVAEIGDLDGWAAYGSLPAGLSPLVGTGLRRGGIYPLPGQPVGLLREIQSTTGSGGPVTLGALGIQRTMTGLTIGATYQLTGTMLSLQDTTPPGNQYRWAVTGVGNGSTASTTNTSTPVAIPSYTFLATATSHVVQLQLAEAASWVSATWFEAVAFYSLKLTEIPNTSALRLRDVAYEGPLSKHFDMACASVGAAWWVDSDNVTQFRQADSQDGIKATFTDTRAIGKPEYTDIAASYDTRNLVNQLTINNHGRDPGTGNALDTKLSVTDTASVTAWGARSASIDMSLREAFSSNVLTNLVTNPSFESTAGTGTFFTNLCTNPSFETNTTGWAAGLTSLAMSATVGGKEGANALRATSSTTTAHQAQFNFSVTSGQSYTLSGWIYRPNTSQDIQFRAAFGGASINASGTAANATANTWQRFTVTGTATSTGTGTAIFQTTAASAASGHVFYVDAVLIENSNALHDYYSGATAAAGDFTYAWTGTAHASTSQWRFTGVTNSSAQGTVSSTAWSNSGSRSVRVIPIYTNQNDSYAALNSMVTLAPSTTYTVIAKARLTSVQTGTLHASARSVVVAWSAGSVVTASETTVPNAIGVYEYRKVFTTPAGGSLAQFRAYNGAPYTTMGANEIWWDDVTVVQGTYTGSSFDGATTDSAEFQYDWTGTVNGSTSTRTQNTLYARAWEILAERSTPEVVISSIKWNAQENPVLATQLDIQDRVRVEFTPPGQTVAVVQDSRIIGIKHELTAERWMITLELAAS